MTHSTTAIVGWDIGGANTKAARVGLGEEGPRVTSALSEPLAMERDSALLVPTLRRLAAGLGETTAAHAVTMTAELSQAFRTKREGVGFVLDALADAFPGQTMRVYTVEGRFVDPAEARERPLDVAASNWAATARFVGRELPDALLVDIGTTSTDIIPITGGEPATVGRTDPGRLLSGELVYTGALRTPVEAVARTVPLWGGHCPLAAERFAVMGDVYLWVGALDSADYSVTPPDGRPATREFAGERLARAVCADAEMLDEAAVGTIARALAEAQLESVMRAMRRVLARHPHLHRAVVAGLGDFIAAEAARRVGLEPIPLAERLGDAARTAAAAAVAWLLAESVVGA
ncbi:MAG TPA: hydantoinase/oxoprolinase family protein [Gemmatimonadales bacterium]|nr:hydantoinase/oxoprolinase family protein [Gemmatimonadales bacterium]